MKQKKKQIKNRKMSNLKTRKLRRVNKIKTKSVEKKKRNKNDIYKFKRITQGKKRQISWGQQQYFF